MGAGRFTASSIGKNGRRSNFELETRHAALNNPGVQPITSHTCKLTDAEAARLESLLHERGYEFRDVPHARFAAGRDKLTVVFYESGKLVVQGKNTREFVEFVLEPEVLQRVELGYEEVVNPDLLRPRIGVDESGKGDFFGPLCIAAVYVNEQVIQAWKPTGIRDSKRITSDKKIREFADQIRNTPGCVTSVVPIGNEAYNRLYAKMRSVNRLLAWGHARVIENLMQQRSRLNPPPVLAISDQFAASKETVGKALMALGREIELVQRHKAESDLAVAAASILARAEFIDRLAALEKACGMTLPRGASKQVDEAAKQLFEARGSEALQQVSKMHFRTAFRAQGLPEPEVREWKRP